MSLSILGHDQQGKDPSSPAEPAVQFAFTTDTRRVRSLAPLTYQQYHNGSGSVSRVRFPNLATATARDVSCAHCLTPRKGNVQRALIVVSRKRL